jgi:aspartate aminotransferase-like enzyme
MDRWPVLFNYRGKLCRMSDVSLKSSLLERLKHSLQALASPPSDQVELLPNFVVKTDELVLDFDHWRSCVLHNYEGELTTEQVASLVALDQLIEKMSKSGDKAFWEEAALYAHPVWVDIRNLASKSLLAFGWAKDKPPSYASEYVRGARTQ